MKLLDWIVLAFVIPPSYVLCYFWSWVADKLNRELKEDVLINLVKPFDEVDLQLRKSYLRAGRFPHGIIYMSFWVLSLVIIGIVIYYL
jgi:hypothetical protein